MSNIPCVHFVYVVSKNTSLRGMFLYERDLTMFRSLGSTRTSDVNANDVVSLPTEIRLFFLLNAFSPRELEIARFASMSNGSTP